MRRTRWVVFRALNQHPLMTRRLQDLPPASPADPQANEAPPAGDAPVPLSDPPAGEPTASG
jgi:hypothetical protein